jgi:hypothetical protein
MSDVSIHGIPRQDEAASRGYKPSWFGKTFGSFFGACTIYFIFSGGNSAAEAERYEARLVEYRNRVAVAQDRRELPERHYAGEDSVYAWVDRQLDEDAKSSRRAERISLYSALASILLGAGTCAADRGVQDRSRSKASN